MDFSLTGQVYKIDDDFNYKELTNPLNDNYYLDGYWHQGYPTYLTT